MWYSVSVTDQKDVIKMKKAAYPLNPLRGVFNPKKEYAMSVSTSIFGAGVLLDGKPTRDFGSRVWIEVRLRNADGTPSLLDYVEFTPRGSKKVLFIRLRNVFGFRRDFALRWTLKRAWRLSSAFEAQYAHVHE